jgi:glutamine synthetase
MPKGMMTIEELRAAVESGEIDTVLVCFVDMQGRLIGKRVTGWFFLEHGQEELHACDYLLTVDMAMEPVPGYATASWDKGYGDFVMRPDMATLRRAPWLEGTALMLADVLDHHGELLPHAPRSMLANQLAKAKEMGFVSKIGTELELYVFDEPVEAMAERGFRNPKTAGRYIQDYHILQTTREEPLIRAIRNALDNAGIPVEFSKGEWGPGQEEINLRYAEAQEMCDRHAIYKNAAKEIAHLQGKAVSFMAKWNHDMAGNSCHIHNSLWTADTDEAVMHDPSDAHGMSKTFKHYLAGQIAAVRDMTYFLAPTINSYKRFQAGSFAPTKAVWSGDNRTAGFRLVGQGPALRVECRIPGADVNPYLATAALVGAGLYGIEHELELEPMVEGNAYHQEVREIPKTLVDAIALLDGSELMRAIFGDQVIDHYVHTARWEQAEFDRKVTDWELQRYFEQV